MENKESGSIYYQYDSFMIEITSEQEFHVTANGEGNFHQYELPTNGIIIKNMTEYNAYRYLLSMGLTLPAGNYELHVKFFYYTDEKCKTEPVSVS